MHNLRPRCELALVLACLLLAAGGTARATGIACTTGGSGSVLAGQSFGCDVAITPNSPLPLAPREYEASKDAMFGVSDWAFAEKVFESGSTVAVGLTRSGQTVSGTWSYDQILATLGISQLMMVAHGTSTIVRSEELAYLIESGAVTGGYFTPIKELVKDPWLNMPKPGPNERPARPIPEPSCFALLGLGLAAVAARVRRRRH